MYISLFKLALERSASRFSPSSLINDTVEGTLKSVRQVVSSLVRRGDSAYERAFVRSRIRLGIEQT
jgi:hypothetical protein